MIISIIAELDDLKDGMAKAYENFAKKAAFNVTENSMFDCREIEVLKVSVCVGINS